MLWSYIKQRFILKSSFIFIIPHTIISVSTAQLVEQSANNAEVKENVIQLVLD